MEAALACLEPDLLKIPSVLVGGTNGKGSTSGFLWELLSRSGKTVGLYSSPHLWHFAERIQVNGRGIDDAYLVSVLESLEKDLPTEVFQALSFFEVTTLLAFRVFKESKVDIMVLEVGLGGRFDATNVADPMLSIITSIALDHQQYLGPTTIDIAREKAGIMRPGRPVIWGGLEAGDPGSDQVMRTAAESLGSPLICEGEHFGWRKGQIFVDLSGSSSSSKGSSVIGPFSRGATVWPEEALPLEIKQAPPFLRSNFSKAVAAYCYLMAQNLAQGDLDALMATWDVVPFRKAPSRYGRFHRHYGAPNGFRPRSMILDVGHNPAGARAFVEGLQAAGLMSHGPLPGLVSILGDKDIGGILDVLRTVLNPLLVFASSSERSWNHEMIPERHRDLAFFSDFLRAWEVLDQGQPEDRPWVITGSVHAIGDVFQVLSIDPLSDT
jgi:dihydrofolate synthase/folylpolyglutamate synthase